MNEMWKTIFNRLTPISNIQLIGISFHVGSGCQDIPIYGEAIATARKLFDFAESVGFNLRLLDIGGGFPGDRNTDIAPVRYQKINHWTNVASEPE